MSTGGRAVLLTVTAALALAWGPGTAAPVGGARAEAGVPGVLDFSADERRRILAHGPWPPPPARDAGNAASGRASAVALGQRLFFEPRLSGSGAMSCASCHVPALAFTDGRARAIGHAALDRHTPALWNGVHERWYGWDGAADSLWSQALRPILDPREMAGSAERTAGLISQDPELACRYQQAFDLAPEATSPGGAEATLVHAAKALGAFVATLVSGRTPFDDFRDALARGDQRTAARYSVEAQRGLRLFVGRAACATCHSGAMFSNGEFADTGRPFFARPGVVDPGRHGGIEALRSSRYHLLSGWSDSPPDGAEALKTRHVRSQHRNFGEFKVQSLRNVGRTAPYMHDGQLDSLEAVVRHYDAIDLDRLHADGEQILKPLGLAAQERADLVAFLHTLTDARAGQWTPPPLARCRSERRPAPAPAPAPAIPRRPLRQAP